VSKTAESARSNLERRQEPADILAVLEQQNVKNPGFLAQVDAQQQNALKADDYKVVRTWITPEPGAGLIRDTPELIAPTDLYAYPGRGGALVFALDDAGKRIPEDPNEKKADDEATKTRRSRKRRRGSRMMAAMVPEAPGMGGRPGELTEQAKKDLAIRQKMLKRQLVGTAGKEEEKKAEEVVEGGPYKEVTKGLRWVAITGVLDHKKVRDNYLTALKNPAVAHPNYMQLDAQRQVLGDDGTWSDWQDVDIEKNREVGFNLPEQEEELAPENVLLSALVDPLPFLKAGYWERVHVVSLVPKEKREIDKTQVASMMPGGEMMGMAPMPMGPGPMGPGPRMGGAGMATAMAPGMDMMGPGMMMGGGFGGTEENTNFPKSDANTVMIRSLDFTVDPDTTYRFRLRVVVFNPNYKREDVSPGTNTKDLELRGPWSEPTNEVTMPADVTAYVMNKEPPAPNAKRNDRVLFQIVRWNPDNGVTVTRNFPFGPGQVVGVEPATTQIPSSEGKGPTSKLVDYNSRQILIDQTGGPEPISQVGAGGSTLNIPSVSLLLRADGSVAVRNEAYDLPDQVRKDMDENYKRELKESDKARENSTGRVGMPGGMPG
jgi:hypothetical protein